MADNDTPPGKRQGLNAEHDDPPSSPVFAQEEQKNEEELSPPPSSFRRASLRRPSNRHDHLEVLVRQKRASIIYLQQQIFQEIPKEEDEEYDLSLADVLSDTQKEQLKQESEDMHEGNMFFNDLRHHFPNDDNRVEIRLKDFNYRVKLNPRKNKIQTVFNYSLAYKIWKFTKQHLLRIEPKETIQMTCVLNNVTLNFIPGKMYLVLGPPESGKTTLLKAVAGRLSTSNGERLEGSILYNGLSLKVRFVCNTYSSTVSICNSSHTFLRYVS